ncbi:MAG: hypothetical protein AAFR77_17710, partial [Cyanobacteria bacterium J06631_2]
GIDITLQVDDITSAQTDRICNTMGRFPQDIEHLSDRFTVWFSGINQNARIIKIQAFAKTNNINSYRAIWSEINLNILQVMEQEGIELFSSTPIAILPAETVKEVREEVTVKH